MFADRVTNRQTNRKRDNISISNRAVQSGSNEKRQRHTKNLPLQTAMKNIIIILILHIFTGCAAKKVYIETHSTDTIYKKEIVRIALPAINSVYIDKPCDSLGNLIPFNHVIINDKVRTVIKTVNNTIVLEQNIDSIVDVRIEEYRSKVKTSKEVIIKYRIPKWCYYSLLITSLLLVFTFRKFIPILKLLPF